MKTQTLKAKRFNNWLYTETKTFEDGEHKGSFIKGIKLKEAIKEKSAQDIINEVVLNDASNPSYWRATKPLKERSYYNYAYLKGKGVLK